MEFVSGELTASTVSVVTLAPTAESCFADHFSFQICAASSAGFSNASFRSRTRPAVAIETGSRIRYLNDARQVIQVR